MQIGQLSSLAYLEAYRNAFSRPLPTLIGLLDEIESLGAGQNLSTGTLVSELGLLRQLDRVDLTNAPLFGLLSLT